MNPYHLTFVFFAKSRNRKKARENFSTLTSFVSLLCTILNISSKFFKSHRFVPICRVIVHIKLNAIFINIKFDIYECCGKKMSLFYTLIIVIETWTTVNRWFLMWQLNCYPFYIVMTDGLSFTFMAM